MTSLPHGLSQYDSYVTDCANGEVASTPLPSNFGRLLPKNPISGAMPDGKPFTAKNLMTIFSGILDQFADTRNRSSDAEAGMTFFGQFVDHDITLDAKSAIGTKIDPRTVRNVRTPSLDLDCVYGNGPEASPHLYSKEHEGYLLFGTCENPLDLARTCKGVALIGDPRNDENIIVSQLQGIFICLHNLLMDVLNADLKSKEKMKLLHKGYDGIRSDMVPAKKSAFEAARRIVRLHYQWLVINDLLPTFVDKAVLKNVLDHIHNDTLPKPFDAHSPIMPIEFSGAAYRFGHATVQNSYTLNSKVGKMDLFKTQGFGFRDSETDIEFEHLFKFPGKSGHDKARPIGRKLAKEIFSLPFIKNASPPLSKADSAKLPHRNIARDRTTFEIASGQQFARAMGINPIQAPKELNEKGITKTPFWYYCLHEAEGHNGKLGPVGGTIVATTLLRLLKLDHESILCSAQDFKPWQQLGATKSGQYSIGHMIKYVEQNRSSIKFAKDLTCPDCIK